MPTAACDRAATPPPGHLAISQYGLEGNVLDTSGSNNDINHGVTFTTGILGAQAGAFDSAITYVDLNNPSATGSLKHALPVTISARVKLSGTSGVQRIVSGDNADNSTVIAGYDLCINSGVLACDYGDAAGSGPAHRRSKSGTTALTTGIWYYVATVIQGPTNIQLYVNGVDNGGAYSGTGGAMAYTTTTTKIDTSNTTNFFNGTLDEVSVYNRALSPAEIAQLPLGP